MIARLWYGRTRADQVDEYLEYVRRTGVDGQRKTPGNCGSLVLTRVAGDKAEFCVFSLWKSMEAIKRFAGDRPEVAVYYPEDEKYLLELEPEVEHYEVSVCELDPRLGALVQGRGAAASRVQ